MTSSSFWIEWNNLLDLSCTIFKLQRDKHWNVCHIFYMQQNISIYLVQFTIFSTWIFKQLLKRLKLYYLENLVFHQHFFLIFSKYLLIGWIKNKIILTWFFLFKNTPNSWFTMLVDITQVKPCNFQHVSTSKVGKHQNFKLCGLQLVKSKMGLCKKNVQYWKKIIYVRKSL